MSNKAIEVLNSRIRELERENRQLIGLLDRKESEINILKQKDVEFLNSEINGLELENTRLRTKIESQEILIGNKRHLLENCYISKDRIELLYSRDFRTFVFRLKKKYGSKLQSIIAIEELAELIKELAKRHRIIEFPKPVKIIEEIADVYLMLRQLEIMYVISNEVDKVIKEKIIRTTKRCELKDFGGNLE